MWAAALWQKWCSGVSDISLPTLFMALGVLLALSAFFSGSETAMMAANRHKLRHRADMGSRGARMALALLGKTDRLLGVILLGNTLVNAAAATLAGYIALAIFADSRWALEVGTVCITLALLVVSEITPKVLAATYADRVAPFSAMVLTPLLRLAYPVVWFVNLFVNAILRVLRLTPKPESQQSKLSPEELRSLVLESAHFLPSQHREMLLNLFELNKVTVEDIMTPRGALEYLDLDQPWPEVEEQLFTSHHSRIPVCRDSLDSLLGLLPVRRLVSEIPRGEVSEGAILAQLAPPYYIPAGTPAFSQLAFFQENRQRAGFVVDEYGEILGLVTLEDIVEEIVGEFTTSQPGPANVLAWDKAGTALVEGGRSLRDINRKLELAFSLDGPKTLNGLILEHFQDIPEAGVSLKIDGVPVEIVQTQDRRVQTVRLFRP